MLSMIVYIVMHCLHMSGSKSKLKHNNIVSSKLWNMFAKKVGTVLTHLSSKSKAKYS